MIWLILYVLFGINTAYITGAIMTIKETDFGKDDILVWGFFWPVIIVGHLVAWMAVKK